MGEKLESILAADMGHCIVCGKPNPHKHHVLYGPNRKWSEKYKLTVPLCYMHHNGSNAGVHFDKCLDLALKKMAQRKFMEEYPEENFVEIFGRNYL